MAKSVDTIVQMPDAEGTVVAVPLLDGRFGLCVVARATGTGIAVGYFFGPPWVTVPTLEVVPALDPAQATLTCRFGDSGIIRGTWRILGTLPGWSRERWPVPIFVRHEELTGRTFLVHYDDRDPARVIGEEQVPEIPVGLRRDGSYSAGLVEKTLTHLLGTSGAAVPAMGRN